MIQLQNRKQRKQKSQHKTNTSYDDFFAYTVESLERLNKHFSIMSKKFLLFFLSRHYFTIFDQKIVQESENKFIAEFAASKSLHNYVQNDVENVEVKG